MPDNPVGADGVFRLHMRPSSELQLRQSHVARWADETFGAVAASDARERTWRFTEEAVELTQSLGMTRDSVHRLVDYVYDRDTGMVRQEIGGVLVTLLVLCDSLSLSAAECLQDEIERIDRPDVQKKIAERSTTKPRF